MDAKQRLIIQNQTQLNRMRIELGIRPTMVVSLSSSSPAKSTFNLRDLNKELINNKQ